MCLWSLAGILSWLAPEFQDHDLERYYVSMMTEDGELSRLEEHILCCAWCAAALTRRMSESFSALRPCAAVI